MLEYLIPFFAYVAIEPIIISIFDNSYLGYVLRTVVTGSLLIYYLKKYRSIKEFKFDFFAILIGILIFVIWISMENLYPRIDVGVFNPYNLEQNLIFPAIILKLVGLIFVAPLVEELFTKGFLLRILIDKDFTKVPIGKITASSFIITTLFFGFAHAMWLPGLITGAILNLLLYKTKSLGSCIQAHGMANICLAMYVLTTQNWMFW